MTLVRLEKRQGSRKRHKTVMIVSCDECHVQHERKYAKMFIDRLHFCKSCQSKACKKNGALYEQIQASTKKTNIERYGAECIFSVPKFRQKAKNTLIARLGVDNPQKSDLIQEKTRLTNIERYGVDNPAKSSSIKAQMIATNIKRYGVPCALANHDVQMKRRQTMKERFNVEYPMQSEELKQHYKASCLKSLGVEYSLAHPKIREKQRRTMVERHGVETGFQTTKNREACTTSEAQQKKYETMKKNGSYCKTSKPEQHLKSVLNASFLNVQHHSTVERYDVDFYIADYDVYVESDGVYWHGLDREFSEILSSDCPRDASIIETMKRDIKIVKLFEHNGLRLLRLDERAVMKLPTIITFEMLVKAAYVRVNI